jgi:hypothetical protein
VLTVLLSYSGRVQQVSLVLSFRITNRLLERVASVDEREDEDEEGKCTECGALGQYGRECYFCDDGSLFVDPVGESVPSECYSSG